MHAGPSDDCPVLNTTTGQANSRLTGLGWLFVCPVVPSSHRFLVPPVQNKTIHIYGKSDKHHHFHVHIHTAVICPMHTFADRSSVLIHPRVALHNWLYSTDHLERVVYVQIQHLELIHELFGQYLPHLILFAILYDTACIIIHFHVSYICSADVHISRVSFIGIFIFSWHSWHWDQLIIIYVRLHRHPYQWNVNMHIKNCMKVQLDMN